MMSGSNKIREISMRRNSSVIARIFIVMVCVAMLLIPGLTMASILTPANLMVAIAGIVASVSTAIWLSTWKWLPAVVTALLIAVPPYPYWLFSDNNGNWYLHFFHGFTLHNLPLPTFGFVFVAAI